MNKPVDYRNIAGMIESWNVLAYRYLTKPNLAHVFAPGAPAHDRDNVLSSVFVSYIQVASLFVKLIHGASTK